MKLMKTKAKSKYSSRDLPKNFKSPRFSSDDSAAVARSQICGKRSPETKTRQDLLFALLFISCKRTTIRGVCSLGQNLDQPFPTGRGFRSFFRTNVRRVRNSPAH